MDIIISLSLISYQDDMSYQGIDSMEDLNKFFIADIQHKNFFQLKNEE